ncbi:hypothetical protein [Georgenia sp. SUBG003]|uniref:hypothetical protein n=1 Tax=Georgenia sp. SUBG003 TaxID=1497974 RepID=UPI003AB8AFA5
MPATSEPRGPRASDQAPLTAVPTSCAASGGAGRDRVQVQVAEILHHDGHHRRDREGLERGQGDERHRGDQQEPDLRRGLRPDRGLHDAGAAVVQAPPGTGKTTLVPPALAAAVEGTVVVTPAPGASPPGRPRDGWRRCWASRSAAPWATRSAATGARAGPPGSRW